MCIYNYIYYIIYIQIHTYITITEDIPYTTGVYIMWLLPPYWDTSRKWRKAELLVFRATALRFMQWPSGCQP